MLDTITCGTITDKSKMTANEIENDCKIIRMLNTTDDNTQQAAITSIWAATGHFQYETKLLFSFLAFLAFYILNIFEAAHGSLVIILLSRNEGCGELTQMHGLTRAYTACMYNVWL